MKFINDIHIQRLVRYRVYFKKSNHTDFGNKFYIMIIGFNLSNMNCQVRKHCRIKVQTSTSKPMKITTFKGFKWQYITFSIFFWIHFNMSWFLRELPVHQAWVIIHFLLEIWIQHFYSYGWPKSLFYLRSHLIVFKTQV